MTTPFDSIDGQTMYDTSRALAFEQTIAFPDDFYSPQLRPGKDGRKYSQYDPGLPLLAAPVVAWSDALAKSQLWNRYAFSAYMVLWIPVFFAAAGLAALYAIAVKIYTPPQPLPMEMERGKTKALLVVFAAGMCTFLWYYARSFFPEGTLAGLLLLAFYGAHRGTPTSILGAGLAVGWMMLIRAPMGIYVVPVAWLVWRGQSPHPQPLSVNREGDIKNTYRDGWKKFAARIGIFLIFPFLAGVMLMYHNFLRYGDPFTSGYAYSGQAFNVALPVGVFGMLFSPGKGVFWYVPILFLSVWYFPVFYRKNHILAQAILIATAGVLLLYGRWWAWHGGWCWGARFLVPLLPLWMLPLGYIPSAKSKISKILTLSLFALSFLISWVGVITNVNYTYESHPEDVIHYTLHGSLITGALEIVADTRTEYLSTFYLGRMGVVPSTALLVPSGLTLIVMVSLYHLRKKMYQD